VPFTIPLVLKLSEGFKIESLILFSEEVREFLENKKTPPIKRANVPIITLMKKIFCFKKFLI
jgi:hypothetical protein